MDAHCFGGSFSFMCSSVVKLNAVIGLISLPWNVVVKVCKDEVIQPQHGSIELVLRNNSSAQVGSCSTPINSQYELSHILVYISLEHLWITVQNDVSMPIWTPRIEWCVLRWTPKRHVLKRSKYVLKVP